MRVDHAEATEQVKHSTCRSKPEAGGSGFQAFYYQCDEKFLTTMLDFPVRVNWVKRPDLVGEIPLSLIARPAKL
jgi:hypothetical protein